MLILLPMSSVIVSLFIEETIAKRINGKTMLDRSTCCFDLWFINPENPLIYVGVSSNKIEHGLSYDNHAQAMTISKSWIYWGIVEEQRFAKKDLLRSTFRFYSYTFAKSSFYYFHHIKAEC